jgi:hypothetical protein
MIEQKKYKIALIVGGWYFPEHLYRTIAEIRIPENVELEKFIVSHRTPSDEILTDINKLQINSNGDHPELKELDERLYSKIADINFLNDNYKYIEAPNTIGDYFFVNQWMESHDYNNYDFIIFMHDDNYLSSQFKNLLVDIFEKPEFRAFSYGWKLKMWIPEIIQYQNFDYIANSAVGHRATARGSFSIWSRNLIEKIGGNFSMKDVELNRDEMTETPLGHMELENWNLVGRNLQYAVQEAKLMPTTFRLSKFYRASKYMLEGERGILNNNSVRIIQNPYYDGYKYFKEYYIFNGSKSQ